MSVHNRNRSHQGSPLSGIIGIAAEDGERRASVAVPAWCWDMDLHVDEVMRCTAIVLGEGVPLVVTLVCGCSFVGLPMGGES